MRFEHRRQPLLPRARFILRLVRSAGLAAIVVLASLFIGVLGYHLTEDMPWLDALLNASMILSGMGPVTELHHDSAKLFASVFALFSGIVFLTISAILFAPIVHRILHHFHRERPKGAE